jgi:pimeloyl-ACP methyl ester carboxylesterase
MSPTVTSKDGTPIAYDRTGDGPPLILVDGALSDRAGSPNGPLAQLLAERFTVYTYDRRGRGDSGDTRPYAVEREVEDIDALIAEAGGSAHLYRAQLEHRVASDRRRDTVRLFMSTGARVPRVFVALMRLMPAWSRMKATAHTLPYDATVMGDSQRGKPLPEDRWASVTVPTLVVGGGKSPAWLRNAVGALAERLPSARHRTLEGQTHLVKPKVLAPVLTEFFAG